jgi:CHAT domain-containing protein
MHIHLSKRIFFALIFLLLSTLPVSGQEKQGLSVEEFRDQYLSAVEEENKEKAEQVVRENKDRASIMAVFLFIQGVATYQKADYKTALRMFMTSLELYRQLGDRRTEGTTLTYIGLIYDRTGDYQKALGYFQDTLKIRREIGDKAGEGRTLNNIGETYLSTGDYQKALDYFQDAMKINKGIGDKVGEGRTLSNIGLIYNRTGDYQRALGYFQDALKIRKEIGDKAGEGTTLNNIGGVYQSTGDYQKALGYFQDALKIIKEVGNKTGEGTILNNIGEIYRSIGDYQKALDYGQDALKINKEIKDKAGEGRTLNNIGATYSLTGDYQKALDYFQDALKIEKEIGDKAGEGTALNNIGGVYSSTRDYQRALVYVQDVLKIQKEIGDKAGEGTTLNNIGEIYRSIGDYQKALDYYQNALKIEKEIGDEATSMVTLENIGYLHEQQREWAEAVAWYKQAIELLEETRRRAGGSEAKESFLEQRINVYTHTVQSLLQLNSPEEAFAYTERSKSRSFLDQLAEAGAGVRKGADPQLLTQEQNLYGQLDATRKNLGKKLPEDQKTALQEKIKDLERQLDTLQQELRKNNPLYADLKYPQPMTLQEVQTTLLQQGEVLLEYLVGEKELYLFVVDPNHFHVLTLPVAEKDLTEKITQLLAPFRQINQTLDFVGTLNQFDLDLADTLYQQLIQPAEPYLKNVQTLLIIPDGVLHNLPFDLLVIQPYEDRAEENVVFSDYARATYLVQKYPIVYAPSASVLKPDILYHAQQEKQPEKTLLALAPFSMEESEESPVKPALSQTFLKGVNTVPDEMVKAFPLNPLKFSGQEVQKIGEVFKPKSDSLLADRATKEVVETQSKDYRYVHLSTHGLLDSHHSMYSGIAFWDGLLQTYEIFNLELHADLVVLSACETGLGELKKGEGVVGLTRAFMYAGTPSVMVSLWSVSDESTAELMIAFYRKMKGGLSKVKALQEAKLELMKGQKEVRRDQSGRPEVMTYGHPFFWAPFVLSGSWR